MKKLWLEILKKAAVMTLAGSVFLTALPAWATEVPEDSEQTESSPETDEQEDAQSETESDMAFHAWKNQTIAGGEEPTLPALSPKDFTKNYNSGKKAEDNLYTLTVSTGLKAAKGAVRYIVIKYRTKDGRDESEYILMTDNPLSQSYQYLKDKGEENQELKQRHNNLAQLNYTVKEPTTPEPLESWSVEEFLFKTEGEISEVKDIQIFMKGGTSWSVQGLSVSRVTKVSGYGEYGFYSGKYFFGLNKKTICRMKIKSGSALTLSPPSGADQRYKLAGGSSAYFSMEQVKGKEEVASPFLDLYTFRLDFADNKDGGIESYLTSNAQQGKYIPSGFTEHLALYLEYKDRNGWTRNVTMPVMLSAMGQYLEAKDTVRTIGLAQRGETVAFTGYLPEYASLVSSKLLVGKAARDGIAASGGLKVKKAGMDKSLDADAVSLAGLSIYKGTCRISNTEDVVDAERDNVKLLSYTTAYSFSENAPMYYYTTTTEEGWQIKPGSQSKLTLKEYKPGDPLVATKSAYNILVRLRTNDENTASGTTADIRFKLHYYDQYGKKQVVPFKSVKELCNEYMGYWPSGSNTKDNFPYSYGMYPGNYVEFAMEVPSIISVSDIEIALAETSDEYILGGINVLAAENFGRRRIYRQDVTGNGSSSNFRMMRSCDCVDLDGFPVNFSTPRVISGGEVALYEFGGEGGSALRLVETDDYPNMRYSMTYEQTKENLGFGKARKSYEVGVKVADNSEKMDDNGDSGSVNRFYFQLQFKNGNSGFVLANQQMSSDGFRAGYTEFFNISVNHNYGDLRSVRIIPEDTQSDNNVFDKLNIEYITVTENMGGESTQYTIDNVGWIGIDYHDEAEAVSIRGRSGRSVGELSSRFTVASKRKVVSLACELSTLPSKIQPEASVACELTYIDINGQPQTTSFDVVSRMADYMKKKAKSYEGSTSGTDAKYYQNMTSISDPQWMLRPSHTDRFILPAIANVKSIKTMKLIAVNRGEGTAEWNIGGIAISEVIADGVLTITSDDEYYRNMTTSPLCRSVSARDYETMTLTAGTAQSLDFTFSENELVYRSDEESWATPVTRLPEDGADTVNVYVYPTADSLNIEGANVNLAVKYSTAFSGPMQASDKMKTYGSGTADAVFYSTGLTATGMQRLISAGVHCMKNDMFFDHAIIQQIRENIVVATYYVPLMGATAKLGLTGKPTTDNMVFENKIQELSISFSDTTKERSLFATENDIAVSFKYKSTLDHGQGDYYSPYVYLTDVGYASVRGGLMAQIPFEVPFVSEITGYRIGSFGVISADVDGAQIVGYSYDKKSTIPETGEEVFENKQASEVYSFDQSASLTSTIKEYPVSGTGYDGDGTVNLLDMTFKTKEASTNHESGTGDPVEMIFYYINSAGALKYRHFYDIRPYIQADQRNFNTAAESNVKLFLPECTDLVAILIVPYDVDETNTATWSIDSVKGFMSLGNKQLNRMVDMQFTERTKDVITFIDGYNLPDVSIAGTGELSRYAIKLTTFDYGPTDGERISDVVSDEHKAAISLYPGETVNFYPSFEGGGGYTAKAMVLSTYTSGSTTRTQFVSAAGLKEKGGILTFTPKKTDEAQTYKIIISSTYNSALVDTFDITVKKEGTRYPKEEDKKDKTDEKDEKDNSDQNSQDRKDNEDKSTE